MDIEHTSLDLQELPLGTYERFSRIWNSLQDEESKKLFIIGLHAKLDKNYLPLWDHLLNKNLSPHYNVLRIIKENKNHANLNPIYLFGWESHEIVTTLLNAYGVDIKDVIQYPDSKIDCENGITLDDFLINLTDDVIVIVPDTHSRRYNKMKILMDYGIPKTQIATFIEVDEMQYFDCEIVKPKSGEIFVDAGSFDANTTVKFVEWCSGTHKKIYIIEPDTANYANCLKTIENNNIKNCTLINKAIWSSETELSFSNTGTPGARIKPAKHTVSTISIDNLLAGEEATFIKFDVEGAELEALKGAKNTIMKYQPHLAVSIYHKPEDLFEIQEYLYQLNPNYRFFIRHYSTYYWEMVLHAM